jgi:hypothetical protein
MSMAIKKPSVCVALWFWPASYAADERHRWFFYCHAHARLEHAAQEVADFLDKIMQQNKDIGTMRDSS